MADQNLCKTSRTGHGAVNEWIPAWPLTANATLFIQDLEPVPSNQELTKMSTNIQHFWYVAKLVALTRQYVELSLPLPIALRAAKADLR